MPVLLAKTLILLECLYIAIILALPDPKTSVTSDPPPPDQTCSRLLSENLGLLEQLETHLSEGKWRIEITESYRKNLNEIEMNCSEESLMRLFSHGRKFTASYREWYYFSREITTLQEPMSVTLQKVVNADPFQEQNDIVESIISLQEARKTIKSALEDLKEYEVSHDLEELKSIYVQHWEELLTYMEQIEGVLGQIQNKVSVQDVDMVYRLIEDTNMVFNGNTLTPAVAQEQYASFMAVKISYLERLTSEELENMK